MMSIKPRTPKDKAQWQRHVDQYGDCQDCALGETAHKHCLGKGHVPADILFIGEAPGTTENETGVPFVGPAGNLLDDWLEGLSCRWHVSNLLCCESHRDSNNEREPKEHDILACQGRLIELVRIVSPIAYVSLGRFAERWAHVVLNRLVDPMNYLHVNHPAYVLRRGGRASKEFNKAMEDIAEFDRRIFNGKKENQDKSQSRQAKARRKRIRST